MRGFLAFGGPPRRHGWMQLEKLVSLDPGRGPGVDFERICAHQGSLLPKVTLTSPRRGASNRAERTAEKVADLIEMLDPGGKKRSRRSSFDPPW